MDAVRASGGRAKAPGGAKITPRDFELCKVQEKSHVFFAENRWPWPAAHPSKTRKNGSVFFAISRVRKTAEFCARIGTKKVRAKATLGLLGQTET